MQQDRRRCPGAARRRLAIEIITAISMFEDSGVGQDARIQQHMRGAASERMFQFMYHQAIAIDTQSFQGDWPPRHEYAGIKKAVSKLTVTRISAATPWDNCWAPVG